MRCRTTFVVMFAVGLVLVTGLMARAVDDPDELLPGRVVIVKTGILFKFVAKPGPTPFALPSGGNDPTIGGATLHVYDEGGSAGNATWGLPAGFWTGLGNPAGSKGFKYRADPIVTSPCKVVLVKPTVVKAVCKESGVTFTPPYTGDVKIVLTLGTTSKRYCATFGGDDVKNDPLFLKRTNAPAAACPPTTSTSTSSTSTTSTTSTSIFTVCGDGLVQGIEQCDDSNTSPGDGCDAICQIEETTNGMLDVGGGSVTSDGEADGATAADPLETTVISQNGGGVSIFESSPGAPPAGYELRGQAATITAPDASTFLAPLELQFDIDATQIRPGENQNTVQVFRSGVLVEPCLGAPGTAVPEPCVAERTLLGGGDVRLRVFATHTSPWTFGYPLCGNGMLDGGETCDPPAGGCSVGNTCKADCTCGPTCDCCAGAPGTLTISHGNAAGGCGSVLSNTGSLALGLSCNTVYFGGGANSIPPFLIPDGALVLKVTACNSTDEMLTLGPTTSAETGSQSTCSSAGCRFGAPEAVPNPNSTPTSTCIMPTISQNLSGLASCGGVINQLGLPLTADIFLTGDIATDPSGTIAGIQPCPLCSGGTCIGGANNGMSCTPGNSTPTAAYPTSNDCPPSPSDLIGTIPVGGDLTTGTVNWTGTVATNDTGSTASGQTRVFVGYCRDADGTLAFENPAHECWENGVAVGTACGGTFESCEQHSTGAFGPNGGPNKTINYIGNAPGCLADALPHSAKVVAPLRIPSFFNPGLDAATDLPGPGAFGLDATMQLQ